MRKSLRFVAIAIAFGLFVPAPRAHAVSKEIIQLQVQVQALQNAVQQLQQQQAAQLGMIQHMLQQNTDTVQQINKTIGTLENQVQAQVQSGGGKIDQVSTQMQNLNNSVDDLQTKIEKLSHQMQAVQSEMRIMQAAPAANGNGPSGPQGSNGAGSASQPGNGGQGGSPQAMNGTASQPETGSGVGSSSDTGSGGGAQTASNAAQGQGAAPSGKPSGRQTYPPIHQLYQVALSDYNAGRYDLAAGEFADVVKDYPYDQLSGQAQFYEGEAYYREKKYKKAIQAYEQVLSAYPGNGKAPAARLHKAYAELALGQRSAGIRDLKDLIGRFPQSPEAAQGRLRLNGLVASSGSAKPSPYQYQ